MQKNGTIISINGDSQLTLNDEEEVPVCIECGTKMEEIKNNIPVWIHSKHDFIKEHPFFEYTWQCKNKSCLERFYEYKEKRDRELFYEKLEEERVERRCLEIATLESNPGAILKRYGIPPKYYQSSFDNFMGGEKYSDACKGVVANPENLLIMGAFGCGKTHLAVSIIRELFKQDKVYSMLFKNVPELLLDIRESFRSSDGESTEWKIIEKYSNINILVLDDLGAEKTSEYSITTLYTLINMRYNDMKPTIVTTNLTIEQIEKQIHPRIASRFAEYKIMKINMPDYRKNR